MKWKENRREEEEKVMATEEKVEEKEEKGRKGRVKDGTMGGGVIEGQEEDEKSFRGGCVK